VLQLLDQGLIVEARVLVRCVLENAFVAAILDEKGREGVDGLVADYASSRVKQGELILNALSAFTDEQRAEVAEIIAETEREYPKRRRLVIKTAFENTRLGPLYWIYSMLSATSVHVSLTSLDRYHAKDSNGPCFELPTRNEEEEISTLAAACYSAVEVLTSVSSILDGKLRGAGAIEQAREKMQAYSAASHLSESA
jgi:hypothetical protein